MASGSLSCVHIGGLINSPRSDHNRLFVPLIENMEVYRSMAQALYRRWRPQDWGEVVGQDHVVRTLRNAVRGGRVAHAYLFAGPRGTGKTTTARLLAKAVNCLAEDLGQRPCGECEHCRAIAEGSFLDLIEIDAASNTSVEDVRDLRERINFAPNKGRYKVYIVDEVHMLSTAAFNALLKTLEVPPKHAIFILATTEVHKIPATVLSRCQRHEFRRIPVATILTYLQSKVQEEGLQVEKQALELIARQATGSLRDAISLLDQLASTGEEVTLAFAEEVLGTATDEVVRGVVEALIDRDVGKGLSLIHAALDKGSDPRQFGRQVVDCLRDLLLVRMGNADLAEATQETLHWMEAQAGRPALALILRGIHSFSRAASEKRPTWQTSLPLELAFVETVGEGEPAAPGNSAPPEQGEAEPEPRQTEPPSRKSAAAAPDDPHQPAPDPQGDLTFQAIVGRWNQVLQAARRRNPRVQALLNSCRPLGLEAGALVIGFSSDLLREKMEKERNLSTAMSALQEALGAPLRLRCVITSKWKKAGPGSETVPPIEEGGMVATAIRELGAQVVDVEQLPKDG